MGPASGGAGGLAEGGGIYSVGTETYVEERPVCGDNHPSNITRRTAHSSGIRPKAVPGVRGLAAGAGGAGGEAAGGALYGNAGSVSSISGALVSLNSVVGGAGGGGLVRRRRNRGRRSGGCALPEWAHRVCAHGQRDARSFERPGDAECRRRRRGGTGRTGGDAGEGIGGGIYVVTGATATLTDTLVFLNFASTSDPDIFGTPTT